MDSMALLTKQRPAARVRVKRPSERRSLSRSATRALDVLEYFGEVRRPLRAVEIARVLSMHPSTTNQLLKTMVNSAHLVFDAHGKTYLPSPRLARFSTWISNTYGSGGRLHDLVQEVHTCTQMVVTITTPNDLFMQIIDVAVPSEQTTERGTMISVFGSVIGAAYLSTLPQTELKRLATRARIPLAEMPATLLQAAQVRRDGYAEGASTGGEMWSIAMPLPMQGLRVPTVLGLAGSPEQVRQDLLPLINVMSSAIKRCIIDPEARAS
jgi:DNA-binding IclR family transcriptional regulator